ncbi:unnamed protein product [Rotaria magnacalcarata]|nr:unnamed protein product [Rotaria magnacalcarata]CAF3782721.1 unnamed protein product [Rotaria magnacalcarata]CAF4024611.1 unnamed protein product [Rotaria magnacalcarata]CAF4080488.1 unnamed protein product [Rotaria magnacalcarata]
MMMMMQNKFYDENNRSLNYTKIDRCQDNISIDNDEYYRQILHSNEHFNYNKDITFKIIFTNRFRLILFIFLILTSQSNALPMYQTLRIPFDSNQPGNLSPTQKPLPTPMVKITDRSLYPQHSYKVHRRISKPIQPQLPHIPSYSNGAGIKIYDQTNTNHRQEQPWLITFQNPNEQQLTIQLKRERQRRAMIEKMVTLFDEDGNGHLEKDELYSMALRSHVFPKFYQYLKQTPS